MKFHGFFQDFSGFFQDFPRIFKSFLFFFFSQKSFFFFFFREKRIFFLEKKKKKKRSFPTRVFGVFTLKNTPKKSLDGPWTALPPLLRPHSRPYFCLKPPKKGPRNPNLSKFPPHPHPNTAKTPQKIVLKNTLFLKSPLWNLPDDLFEKSVFFKTIFCRVFAVFGWG